MGKQWTDKEDKFLTKMRNAGESYKEIGYCLGRTCNACTQRAFVLGITKKRSDSLPIDEPVMTREEMYSPEPTTWIGRVKRLLGVSDIGAQ